MKARGAFFYLSSILLIGGCASTPSVEERHHALDTIALTYHLQAHTIDTSHFPLYSLSDSSECHNGQMRVYIEGDGLSWINRNRLSNNPTPITPLSAKLMSIDSSHCKLYLARPCQYVYSNTCKSDYWGKGRFSTEVIESYSEALDTLKKRFGIRSFILIGYSGGGAVAVLSAAQRNDVAELVTVAGNLDTDAWVRYHHLSLLEGSLNPSNFASKIEPIPQIHFIGAEDKNIIPLIFEGYKSRFSKDANMTSIICDQCTHNSGWVEQWYGYSKKF